MSNKLRTPAMRKNLFEIYNEVNKSIYGFGAIESKISFVDNFIIFFSRHNRVPILVAIEEKYSSLKQSVDSTLMKEFTERLRASLKEKLDIVPKAILRDYDANSLIAVTVVVLDEHLSS